MPRDDNSFLSCNNIGSVATSSTSCNSDDEDEIENSQSAITCRERRRNSHRQAEQKRRNSLKTGYNSLQELFPSYQPTDPSGRKLTKAIVIQNSIDHIQYLQQEKEKLEEKRNALRKQVVALRIMQTNYEQIVKAQQVQPGHTETRISDEVKFSVFQAMMEQLFLSFNTSVSARNFSVLSGGIISWLEECCKPQTLRDTVHQVLQRHSSHMRGQQPDRGFLGNFN